MKNKGLTAQERKARRQSRGKKDQPANSNGELAVSSLSDFQSKQDARFLNFLAHNEDKLIDFVAKVSKLYQEKLNRKAPFMTFVIIGMQSSGKSTIMERFMSSVLNIVQEGTGTRCPLDTTCVYDPECAEPLCELSGKEIEGVGQNLTEEEVFQRITKHNRKLGDEDKFSTEPIHLVYRSSKVQNMRFVDTPGVISNKSTGADNREEIKNILVSEMENPNAQLCVLLEPKEFATNPIIDFLDEKLGGRDKWQNKAIYIMTKFDKQLDDSRSAQKANAFFREFHDNNCYPFLSITPTLDREDLDSDSMIRERKALLEKADKEERRKFREWVEQHENSRQQHGSSEVLNPDIGEKVGFAVAKKKMHEIMLQDLVERIPEVVAALRKMLNESRKELDVLEQRKRLTNPVELKAITTQLLYTLRERIMAYLDGDLASSIEFPEKLQTLEEEIDGEEQSDWCARELNFHSEKEESWRDRIAELEGEYPETLHPDTAFLGGKQIHRAMEFYKAMLIEALPNPYDFKDKVANATGFLSGSLSRENWEHALVQLCKVLMEDVTHPGANYLVKHMGCILRRLFALALEDAKKGKEFSSTFKLLPVAVEKYLMKEFDDMLWSLMQEAANVMHMVLKPMYSFIDPDLPTFHPSKLGSDTVDNLFKKKGSGYVAVDDATQAEESASYWITQRMQALTSRSGMEAKAFLKSESAARARNKKSFLPDNRSSMITEEETEVILRRAFEYIVALMELAMVIAKFQILDAMYERFKKELGKTFMHKGEEAKWSELVQPDAGLETKIEQVVDRIKSLEESLTDVQRIQDKIY
jgi:hypothetical protein